ncbi:MAG: CvpA family protein [Planctomycetota bacterium]|jgi:hypothetical protein
MASIVVIAVILGCAAALYLKCTLVRSFATLIAVISAAIAAFAYFELLANLFISRGKLIPWAQSISFVLLFIVAFAILQAIASVLTRRPVDFGVMPERVGRVFCGIFTGLVVSGFLLTAAAMAPLPIKYPYQRFTEASPDPDNPKRALLNADGFATGWFNIVSSGSLSGKKSFAVLHSDFLDQLFLNRHGEEISVITKTEAIQVPAKQAAWPAPEGLKDTKGRPAPQKSGHNLTIVRVGISKRALKDAGTFIPAQLRLICKQKTDVQNPLAGKAESVYPVGYLQTAEKLQTRKLNDRIELESGDFRGKTRWIDFAFHVRNDSVPVLVEFKQNNAAVVPKPVTYDQAPEAAPFIPLQDCTRDLGKLKPITSAKIHGIELAALSKILSGTTLQITEPNDWLNVQTASSMIPAQFEEGATSYARAELKIEIPPEDEEQQRKSGRRHTTARLLKPLKGYKLLSLKCNNPSTGTPIRADRLPVLVELLGRVHHPVGVVASGQLGDSMIYEVDYCALTAEQIPNGLTIAEDGSVAKPFPEAIWLTQQVQAISEFYLLYLVKPGNDAIITSVQPADSQAAATFEEHGGFLVK